MKIGLLVLSIGEGGQKGYYNAQEIGLGKALDQLGHKVTVYKLTPQGQDAYSEKPDGTRDMVINYIPAGKVGNNSFPNTGRFDRDLDALICFSDMQIAVPRVYRWAKRNGIRFFPYIGVVESHSGNPLKRKVMNLLFQRDLQVYRKCHCIAKTPYVQTLLANRGVKKTIVIPVGLDTSLLKQDYTGANVTALRLEYGYRPADKIILYIGRLTEEKQPLRMIELFADLYYRNEDYKLLMVGRGELKESVLAAIKERNLSGAVKLADCIPNQDIWKLYRIADCFVNLNQQEIFGMAILEAMYYECKVVAWRAPGPQLIIEDGISGYLAESNEEVIAEILREGSVGKRAHGRVAEEFTWDIAAKRIEKVI